MGVFAYHARIREMGGGMGRRTALTPELQVEICDMLQWGVDVQTACARVGINRATYHEWIKRGKAGDEPYADFVDATDIALASCQVDVTRNIIRASKTRWQAGAWWIKWRHTQGVQRVELTGKDGAPVTGTLTPESADLIRQRILYGDRAPPKRLPESTTPGVAVAPVIEHERESSERDDAEFGVHVSEPDEDEGP